MNRTLIAAVCLSLAGCGALGPLLRLPGNSGSQLTYNAIACGIAEDIVGAGGVVLGASAWALALPLASGSLKDLCRSIEDGGQAMNVTVLRDKPTELKQLRSLTPGQRFVAIGDLVTNADRTVLNGDDSITIREVSHQQTLFARSIRPGGKR